MSAALAFTGAAAVLAELAHRRVLAGRPVGPLVAGHIVRQLLGGLVAFLLARLAP